MPYSRSIIPWTTLEFHYNDEMKIGRVGKTLKKTVKLCKRKEKFLQIMMKV